MMRSRSELSRLPRSVPESSTEDIPWLVAERPEQIHGAHAKSPNNEYNENGIGICLVGNFEETQPSDAQMASVKRLVGVLKSEYQLTDGQVIRHRDVKATACPGKNFPIAEISRSSEFSVLAGQPGTYVTNPTGEFQVVTVKRSNVR